jgi:hypothetical protein
MKKHSNVSSAASVSSKNEAFIEARKSVQLSRKPRHSDKSSALEVITIPSGGSAEAPSISSASELKRVRFGAFNPDAHEIFVVGSFNNWNPRATPMKRDALGDWSVEVRLPPGEYRYRFLADGEWRDDPSARMAAMNSYGSFDAVVSV